MFSSFLLMLNIYVCNWGKEFKDIYFFIKFFFKNNLIYLFNKNINFYNT